MKKKIPKFSALCNNLMESAASKRVPVSPGMFLPVMLALVIPGQVWGFYPFTLPNYMMVGRVMKTLFHVDRLKCLHECYVNEKCVSYNFEPSTLDKGLCEMNRCGVMDNREREKSLIYKRGVFFHQIRPSKPVFQVTSKITTSFFLKLSSKQKVASPKKVLKVPNFFKAIYSVNFYNQTSINSNSLRMPVFVKSGLNKEY